MQWGRLPQGYVFAAWLHALVHSCTQLEIFKATGLEGWRDGEIEG